MWTLTKEGLLEKGADKKKIPSNLLANKIFMAMSHYLAIAIYPVDKANRLFFHGHLSSVQMMLAFRDHSRDREKGFKNYLSTRVHDKSGDNVFNKLNECSILLIYCSFKLNEGSPAMYGISSNPFQITKQYFFFYLLRVHKYSFLQFLTQWGFASQMLKQQPVSRDEKSSPFFLFVCFIVSFFLETRKGRKIAC